MIGKRKRAVVRHRAQPDHAGRRLLGPGDHVLEQLAATLVQLRDKVGAVVHRDLRVRVEHRLDVRVVAGGVLALHRERRDAVVTRSAAATGSCVESGLLAQSVDVRPAGLQRDRQVGRLARDMQARTDAESLERSLGFEALANDAQHGHLASRPFDEALPVTGQAWVRDIEPRRFQHVWSLDSSIGIHAQQRRVRAPAKRGRSPQVTQLNKKRKTRDVATELVDKRGRSGLQCRRWRAGHRR